MDSLRSVVAPHVVSALALLLLAVGTAACSSEVDVPGAGGSGEGGSDDGAEDGGSDGGTDGPTGGPTTGGGSDCACDEGLVDVPPCDEGDGGCQTKICGSETIACREPVPCDPNACVSDNITGLGCSDVGEECQTADCHGNPAALILCTEDHLWTHWDELYFTCGDETCTHGLEYCEDVSDAGANQVQRCLPIPAECSADDFCPCAPAMEVCPDASCGTFGGGGWLVSCW